MRTASTHQYKTNHHFPDVLVLDIHIRLPPKSLFRFKSVSKSWGNQISDPYFQNTYHKQSKKSPNLLFCKSTPRSRAIPMDEGKTEWSSLNTKTLSLTNSFTTKGKVLNMMVTCQGMAGFLNMKDNGDETKVHLYCLITKKLLVLPTDKSSNFTRGPIVGFGIGYLPFIQKYKVSLLFMKISECSQPFPRFNCQVIEISNSNNCDGSTNYSNWRIVEEDLHDLVDCFLSPVFVENTICWKAWCNDRIVSFDAKNEKFLRLNYPNGDNFSVTDNICLVDLQGKLGLSVTSTSQQACFTMVIWKLQDSVNNIWEKTYTISPGEANPNCLKPIRPIYFQDDEVIIMYYTGCLMFYNLEKNTYKILNVDVSFDHSLVGMYYESLHYS